MLNGWAYLRRKVAEAMLAAGYDVTAALQGKESASLSEEQAAKAFLALLLSANPEARLAPAPASTDTKSPPQLAPPQPDGVNGIVEPPRRGPGRPRKFQEPSE